ncbi:1-acyl-sn-glycerol-3-phosphate acyltransferase [Nocardioides szechwanensis]|uniref:1-acyl-sn-glycerol-3-phosphate acyltransferases n=1 Tax=Nocardioides szechwanensis TaxID=1005944 RepID=A0A1G9UR30_9ACTN|nr:lysophospholipid acyltransferase family protein [Nocardioides szechwanensis]GEP33184.1 1-acyl-sn-glycerol-3-phosphate acyltransferase [Nocardioides szechwanensis]SDM61995.1 1-acyl-sn-glycerol-3-phosphate acyltransferases [Nocardioides szechwanensis]
MTLRERKLQEKRGWAFSLGVAIVKPTLLATTTHEWLDTHKLPESGGYVVVLNHVSHLDPLTAAHLLYDHGRIPRYLAKSGLFKNRWLGGFLRSAGQIPVERMSKNAVGAFAAAVTAVREGKVVVVYPEGTLTRDRDLWPMAGKSGAARIALETGCPVIPVGQWGAHQILYPYAKKPDLFPRKRIRMRVGDPVELGDLSAQPLGPQVISQATDRIMAALTGLVEDLRGEKAPAVRYDMRQHGDPLTGNPRSTRRNKKDEA